MPGVAPPIATEKVPVLPVFLLRTSKFVCVSCDISNFPAGISLPIPTVLLVIVILEAELFAKSIQP